jgi:hypothetical protein
MGPCGQQDHRQIGLIGAQRTKQRRPFFARGRVRAEVHIGDDEIDALARQRRKALLRRQGRQRLNVMQTEQQRQCLGHCRVVIDDEYGAHGAC